VKLHRVTEKIDGVIHLRNPIFPFVMLTNSSGHFEEHKREKVERVLNVKVRVDVGNPLWFTQDQVEFR